MITECTRSLGRKTILSVLLLLIFSRTVRGEAKSPVVAFSPIANLGELKVGTYADYRMTDGTQIWRWAVVATTPERNTIELVCGAGRKTERIMLSADPASYGKVIPPMLEVSQGSPAHAYPILWVDVQPFILSDAKTLVGEEQTTVAAGTYKTLHYQFVNTTGTVQRDWWLSDSVAPLGLVKVVTTSKNTRTASPPMWVFAIELAATGTDHRPRIATKATVMATCPEKVAGEYSPAARGLYWTIQIKLREYNGFGASITMTRARIRLPDGEYGDWEFHEIGARTPSRIPAKGELVYEKAYWGDKLVGGVLSIEFKGIDVDGNPFEAEASTVLEAKRKASGQKARKR